MTPLSTGWRALWITLTETRACASRSSRVHKIIRTFSMVAVIVVAVLGILALVTQVGVLIVQRAHPAPGVMVEVAGAALHVVELGPRDAAGPPVVMLHG